LQIGAAPSALAWGKIVSAHRFTGHGPRKFKSIAMGGALLAAPVALALTLPVPEAYATPKFARQTGKSCSFCHAGVPRLNDTGLAFKNNGFVLPQSDKAPPNDQKAPAQ
jgi:hypothetical protein